MAENIYTGELAWLNDYICYDGDIGMCEKVKNMSEDEREREFWRLFGEYYKDDDEDE